MGTWRECLFRSFYLDRGCSWKEAAEWPKKTLLYSDLSAAERGQTSNNPTPNKEKKDINVTTLPIL